MIIWNNELWSHSCCHQAWRHRSADGCPSPRSRHCQLSGVCLVLRAGRHQYCRYYPRNNYHTLSLAESEYRGIEARALWFLISRRKVFFNIITNIFMTKEWIGWMKFRWIVNCPFSVYLIYLLLWLCYVIKDVTEQIRTELWLVREWR